MSAVLFFIAAVGAITGAIAVVMVRNPFYSVLALVGHLISLAALFLLLRAEFVAAADMPETTKLLRTLDRWWDPIEVFITTRVTNARSEAANLTCKNLKRTGRGYRNQANYHARITLHRAARTTA